MHGMHSTGRRSVRALALAVPRPSHEARDTRRRAVVFAALAGAGALLIASVEAGASPITDKSYFFKGPSTLIDFETDGSGAPISLIDGQTLTMPTNAYQSKGVLFSSGVKWVNDGTPAFDAAQNISGTPTISIPSSGTSSLTITFANAVHAVGIWIANNFQLDPAGPTMTARDAANNVIETVSFGNQGGGSQFVDGRIMFCDFGFMGIASESAIKSITIAKNAAILDDLIFDQVPAPAGAGLLGAGLAMWSRRRRAAERTGAGERR